MSRRRLAGWVAAWLLVAATVFAGVILISGNGGVQDGLGLGNPGEAVGPPDPTEVGPPPGSHGLGSATVQRLMSSVVHVRGLDCRTAQVGSGFVVDGGPDVGRLVATAAHVVAGIDYPTLVVSTDAGIGEQTGRVVAFDPVADLALVRPVDPDALGDALRLGEPAAGTVGGLLVHDGQDASVVPVGIAHRIRATGADLYGDPGEGRDALVLAAAVETGHSGGPVIDADGAVVGVAFSRTRGGRPVAYAVQAGELSALLAGLVDGEVPAGPCASG